MIEAIQVIRDVVIILSAVIGLVVAAMVCRAIQDLTRQVEALRLSAEDAAHAKLTDGVLVDLADVVTNPVKGVLTTIIRLCRRARRA